MTTEFYILLILGLSFLILVIKTAISEALRHSKPTTINHGTIVHHHYGEIKPHDVNQSLPMRTETATQIYRQIRRDFQQPLENLIEFIQESSNEESKKDL